MIVYVGIPAPQWALTQWWTSPNSPTQQGGIYADEGFGAYLDFSRSIQVDTWTWYLGGYLDLDFPTHEKCNMLGHIF